jgi:hypothetical protein
MMSQAWFEMAEIRRRKFASSAWIPLRAIQPICNEGNRGHLGFKDEFFGAGSLAAPVDLKEKANKLGWPCCNGNCHTARTAGQFNLRGITWKKMNK